MHLSMFLTEGDEALRLFVDFRIGWFLFGIELNKMEGS